VIPVIVGALRAIVNPRFFETERGFQAEFLANLRAALPALGLPGDAIVEQEYQKRFRTHGIKRRPDVIIHVPTLLGGNRREGNFAVFALKLTAGPARARSDFDALDAIIRALDYPLGVFINIAAKKTHAEHYQGAFPSRLHWFAVYRSEEGAQVRHAYYNGTRFVEEASKPPNNR
jgi:hypothetical protein